MTFTKEQHQQLRDALRKHSTWTELEREITVERVNSLILTLATIAEDPVQQHVFYGAFELMSKIADEHTAHVQEEIAA